eukprot:gb/GEZJ01002047.1/.p2 GENE.gb/GEZJ01002047.1/~~gb/GEZJ01002047.1/.p2  ORF type:complete len:556 (-),score=72.18 gb/GEZJ01002047.1/:2243-3910(-)
MLAFGRLRSKLRAALDACDERKLKAIISQSPTSLPQSEDPLVIASCLEQVRVTADLFIEACDYDTAFETAVDTRSALISAQVLPWTVAVLKNFAFDERVVSRIALTLAHLAGGLEPRGEVGSAGAVDQLAIAWRSHPSCISIIQALISLSTGHIDNISRFMRRRGITTAVNALNTPEIAQNTSLVEHILVLVGLCTICTPDNRSEGAALVPAILGALKSRNHRKRIGVAKHAFRAIANIAECWTKEKAGYDLGDKHSLVQLIITCWISTPNSRDMALAASWATAALYGNDRGVLEYIKPRSRDLGPVLEKWRLNLRTVDFLATLHEAVQPEKVLRRIHEGSAIDAKASQRMIEVVLDSSSDTHSSENEVDGSEPDHGTNAKHGEESSVSFDERSMKSDTLICDSDSDDNHSSPPEREYESFSKLNPMTCDSVPKEIDIVVDSGSEDEGSALAEATLCTRSTEERSTMTNNRQTRRRKRAINTEKEVRSEIIPDRQKEELVDETPMRRSKRHRKPNPKYESRSRLLKRTKLEASPLVSCSFIVPPNQNYRLLGSRR